jgi:hypothetical protein
MRLWLFHIGSIFHTILNPVSIVSKKFFLFVWRNPIVGILLCFAIAGTVILLDKFEISIIPNNFSFVGFFLSVFHRLKNLDIMHFLRDYLLGFKSAYENYFVALFFYFSLMIASVAARRNFISALYQEKINANATSSIITLLMIHKFKRREMFMLGQLNHETIREIAKYIWSTRFDREWVRTIVDK